MKKRRSRAEILADISIMEKVKKTAQEKEVVNTESLVKIGIYLSGVKDGKGNLRPLGIVDLEQLWKAIEYLKGDVRYLAERDKKD